VAKGYGCEAAGGEFKSEVDLLLLMLCEDNKLSWLYGSRKIVNTHPNKIKKSKQKSNFNM
jgi:hypothetical protein